MPSTTHFASQPQTSYPGIEILDETTEIEDCVQKLCYWFAKDSPPGTRYIRLSNIPDTLAGDIVRLRSNLPNLTNNWDIDGDIITKVVIAPEIPDEDAYPNDFDHTSADLALLPAISVDESKHFIKQSNYKL